MSNSAKQISSEVKRDFKPLVKFLKSAEILRGEQNEFDEPVIGNFAKYAISYGDIFFAPGSYEKVARETRKILFEMIAEALNISIDEIF